jgi:hypothetical protein
VQNLSLCVALPQVKHITTAVGPEEYDAAVQRDPSVSTHAATGDHRTGRQLLADAPADRQRSIAGLSASQAGRAVMWRLSMATEAFAAARQMRAR